MGYHPGTGGCAEGCVPVRSLYAGVGIRDGRIGRGPLRKEEGHRRLPAGRGNRSTGSGRKSVPSRFPESRGSEPGVTGKVKCAEFYIQVKFLQGQAPAKYLGIRHDAGSGFFRPESRQSCGPPAKSFFFITSQPSRAYARSTGTCSDLYIYYILFGDKFYTSDFCNQLIIKG